MPDMSWEGIDVAHSSLPEQISLHMRTETYAVFAEARMLLLEKWRIPLQGYQNKYALHAVANSSNIAMSTYVSRLTVNVTAAFNHCAKHRLSYALMCVQLLPDGGCHWQSSLRQRESGGISHQASKKLSA